MARVFAALISIIALTKAREKRYIKTRMSTFGTYNRKNPFPAKLARTVVLTGEGSGKDTRHFEIDLSGSGIEYLPGDSLAVQPLNDPKVVEDIVGVLKLDPDEIVGEGDDACTLREALTSKYAITTPGTKLLKAIAAIAPHSSFAHLLDSDKKVELAQYLWGREIIDLLTEHPEISFSAEEFLKLLQKLQVRLYSISSSLAACPESVHLTVATVQYESFGRMRQGVASGWMAGRIDEMTEIPVFITPNNKFRLPEPDNEVPIIMVGPGTGVAPFRAFVQERRVTGAKGKAWLFFGEQHQSSEFFYEDEWERGAARRLAHQIDDGVFARPNPQNLRATSHDRRRRAVVAVARPRRHFLRVRRQNAHGRRR